MANYQSTHTGQEHDAYCTKSQLIDLVYPVGAIYISVNSTSPQTLFGGTWQQISDTFLLAAGSTYSAGSTGGSATVTLDVNTMPSHTHEVKVNSWAGDLGVTMVSSSASPADSTWYGIKDYNENGYHYSTTAGSNSSFYAVARGGGGAHNNMPPYLAVYVWKRTA